MKSNEGMPSPVNPEEENKGGKNEKEKELSRRGFLGGVGVTVAGSLSGVEALANFTDREKERIEKDVRVMEASIDAYMEQKTTLTEKEINEILGQCGFIGDTTKIEHAQVHQRKDIHIHDEIKRVLTTRKQHDLAVVHTDFSEHGITHFAFYYNGLDSIVINQETDTQKKRKIEKFIYDTIASYENKYPMDDVDRRLLDAELEGTVLSDREKFDRNWYRMKIDQIPDIISHHFPFLERAIRKFRFEEAREHIGTKAILPHEAFHHFYEEYLGKEGYEGPSVIELLALAIREKYKRFGEDEVSYAPIKRRLYDVDEEDEEAVMKFSEELVAKHDILSYPEYSNEKLGGLSEEEQYHTTRAFHVFLNEYLARIYNGALGNTPESVRSEIHDIGNVLNVTPEDGAYEEVYHKPTDEELRVLRRMKWKGKPILPEEKNDIDEHR